MHIHQHASEFFLRSLSWLRHLYTSVPVSITMFLLCGPDVYCLRYAMAGFHHICAVLQGQVTA